MRQQRKGYLFGEAAWLALLARSLFEEGLRRCEERNRHLGMLPALSSLACVSLDCLTALLYTSKSPVTEIKENIDKILAGTKPRSLYKLEERWAGCRCVVTIPFMSTLVMTKFGTIDELDNLAKIQCSK